MNELLPFGEYINPQQEAATAAMLETWELERFLIRLAAAEQRQERRASRHSRIHRGSSHGHDEASPPQLIPQRNNRNDVSPSSFPENRAGHLTGSTEMHAGPSSLPSSWNGGGDSVREDSGHSNNGGGGGIGDALSPTFRAASQAIKSRLSSFKFTQELKHLFGSASATTPSRRPSDSQQQNRNALGNVERPNG